MSRLIPLALALCLPGPAWAQFRAIAPKTTPIQAPAVPLDPFLASTLADPAISLAPSSPAEESQVFSVVASLEPVPIERLSQVQTKAQPQTETEQKPRPLDEAAALTKELGKGSDPQGTFFQFYAGAGHDHALLGAEGEAIVSDLVHAAWGAIESRPGENRVSSQKDAELERGIASAKRGDRIWTWIEGSQGVRRVPFYEWWINRRENGEKPPGLNLEHLELEAATLNSTIREYNRGQKFPLPTVSLKDVHVLVDSFWDPNETRASFEKKLGQQGRPNIRDTGAFNLYGTLALMEDLLLFPGIVGKDILAAVLHETLARAQMPHEDVVDWVEHLGGETFKNAARSHESPPFSQNRLEDKVHAARVYAAQKAAGKPEEPEQDSDLYNQYVIPFDPTSLTIAPSVGNIEDDKPAQRSFKKAFLAFVTDNGSVFLGISAVEKPRKKEFEEPEDPEAAKRDKAAAGKWDSIIPAERPITFWWANGTGKKDWQEIALMREQDIVQTSIHSQFADDEAGKHPGPMITHQRFYNELLEDFDRAVRAYLEDPRSPAESTAFVEEVYLSFRYNFGREYLGTDLPEFTYRPVNHQHHPH